MDIYNLEAEQSVLGAAMTSIDVWHDIQGLVLSSDFFREDHQLIFYGIERCVGLGQDVDAITLNDWLSSRYPEDKYGGLSYLGRLQKDVVTVAFAKSYAEIVKEKSQRRRLIFLLQEKQKSVAGGSTRVLDEVGDLQSRLESLNSETFGESKTFAETLTSTMNHIEEMSDLKKQGGVIGVPTGIPEIDRRTGGLQPKRLIVIAARPSVGKTALAQQIAIHAASFGHGVGILSLEMGEEELAIRSMAHKYQINGSKITFGDDEALEELAIKMCERPIKDYPIHIDTNTYDLGGIISRITEWKRKNNIELVIVDHIGLIEVPEGKSRSDDVGKISRALKKLTKRLSIPIIIVSQLNRGPEKEKRLPALSDLRESGNIEQDVDIAIFLHARDGQGSSTIQLDIGLLKNRQGRRGWIRKVTSEAPAYVLDGAHQTIREVDFEYKNN